MWHVIALLLQCYGIVYSLLAYLIGLLSGGWLWLGVYHTVSQPYPCYAWYSTLYCEAHTGDISRLYYKDGLIYGYDAG